MESAFRALHFYKAAISVRKLRESRLAAMHFSSAARHVSTPGSVFALKNHTQDTRLTLGLRSFSKLLSQKNRVVAAAVNSKTDEKPSGDRIAQDRRIVPVELHKEASESYVAYALSVTIGRALPDIRDGLKPVHRRILYAMHELGLRSDKSFKKCARVVGEVLGKYHPHGDVAVYDAMVRLAQDFSLRSPLINGHGNFGSLDGDPAAAMRYTECKLQALAEAMFLADLNSETVDFAPNFDGSASEPLVLPARLPNLLINGSSGIAVGMATTIPPHNLSEVVDALCALIKNPNATVQELMKHMPGPDFPTGGEILGTSGLLTAYRTGKGQITVRGKAEVEKPDGRIVIKEIPYSINKAAFVSKIADLVNNKVLDGVSDVRDESDKNGMRIVVEVRKGVVPEVVLNNLYKHTLFQTRYSFNTVGILDKQPQTFGLKELLEHFLEFRRSTVERRTRFELKQADERNHILEGYLKALKNQEGIFRTIRGSKDSESASRALQEGYKLSKVQAEGILSMPFRRLTSLESSKLSDEHTNLVAQITDLKHLLSSKERIMQLIQKEAIALKEKFGTPRRTVIRHDSDGEVNDIDVVANDKTLLTLSEKGYIKRMQPDVFAAQRRGTAGKSGGRLRSNDAIVDSFVCNSHDYVLFFSEKGTVFCLRAYQIPECSRTSAGNHVVKVLPVPAEERITSIFPLSEFKEDEFLIMLTAKGYVKRTPMTAFAKVRHQGIVAIQLVPGDELKWVRQANDLDTVVIGSEMGMVVRVPLHDQLRVLSRSARGVRAMRLKGTDNVAAMHIIPGDALNTKGDDQSGSTEEEEKESKEEEEEVKDKGAPWLLFVSEHGLGKRVPVTAFPQHHLNRVGSIGIKFNAGDKLAALHALGSGLQDGEESAEEIVIGSQSGIFNRMKVREISVQGRMARGVRVMRLEAGDRVQSVSVDVDVSTSANDV